MLAVRFGEGERGMKTVWIASLAAALASPVWAQSTIYKHVDDSGRVTYSNKPMKGAVVIDLEPLTTIPSSPAGSLVPTIKTDKKRAPPGIWTRDSWTGHCEQAWPRRRQHLAKRGGA